MNICDQLGSVRDYAFDELPAPERPAVERHVAACEECAQELDQLRLTTAALRTLPEREIPQRIAFVSDKVFAPSAAARFFGGFWNSAARLGFASACLVAGALVISAYHHPVTEVRTIVAANRQTGDIDKIVNDAVIRAVGQIRMEDAQFTRAALAAADAKHEQEHRILMDAVTVLQDRQNTGTLLAAADTRNGAGQ